MRGESNSLHIFEVLATQHEHMLMAYLVSLVGDHALAEDVAQQALVIAYRKIHTLKDPATFPSWLRGIARLEGLAAMRRQGREIPIAPEAMQELDEAYRRFELEHPTKTWEERFQLVEECFEGLPEAMRTVCRLHYLENHKAWQIAESLGLNLNTVLKRLERSRTAIRDCVESRMAMAVHEQ
jgi:RNA polymerase sigma-70 factor (ECF subfamily)